MIARSEQAPELQGKSRWGCDVVHASGVRGRVEALAEERGAHADAGAALLDCHGEVVGHADGELRQSWVNCLLLIAQDA